MILKIAKELKCYTTKHLFNTKEGSKEAAEEQNHMRYKEKKEQNGGHKSNHITITLNANG